MKNLKSILTFVKLLNSDNKCRNERRKTPLEDGHRPQEQRWVKMIEGNCMKGFFIETRIKNCETT